MGAESGRVTGTTSLAVVVSKDRVDTVLDALQTEGVYDDSRRIAERDEQTVAIPVTSAPDTTTVETLTTGAGGPRRRGLPSRLRRLGWSESAIDRVPSTWSLVGDVIVADFSDVPRNRRTTVARVLAEMHGAATVVHQAAIRGPHRIPDVEILLGGRTLTEHVEAGTRYALDVASVMFSPGNQAERRRMGDVVSPGDHVIDMYAGIGYFTLPMARAGATVHAVERNSQAYAFLLDNVRRNEVDERVAAVCGDCRDVLSREFLPEQALSGAAMPDATAADHVVLGHFDAAGSLEFAFDRVRPGGTIYLHVTASRDADSNQGPLQERIESVAGTADRAPTAVRQRRVKSYAAGVDHVVLKIEC